MNSNGYHLKNLHNAALTGEGLSEISRNENSHLPGQHTYSIILAENKERTCAPSKSGDQPTGRTWIYYQCLEIIIRAGSPNNE